MSAPVAPNPLEASRGRGSSASGRCIVFLLALPRGSSRVFNKAPPETVYIREPVTRSPTMLKVSCRQCRSVIRETPRNDEAACGGICSFCQALVCVCGHSLGTHQKAFSSRSSTMLCYGKFGPQEPTIIAGVLLLRGQGCPCTGFQVKEA